MKKYNIVVNGTAYAVEVEEAGTSTLAAAPTPTPTPTPAAAPAQAAPTKPSAGAQVIESPMPGTIFDIKVKPGESVREGAVLLILEAMKMENEIIAPKAGKVDTIQVANGAAVNAGDVLVTLI